MRTLRVLAQLSVIDQQLTFLATTDGLKSLSAKLFSAGSAREPTGTTFLHFHKGYLESGEYGERVAPWRP